MAERRSKRSKTVSSNIGKANDSDVARMRELRISKLESDAADDAMVDDDDDDDFEVRCAEKETATHA